MSLFQLANTVRDTVLEFKQRASKVFRPVEAAVKEAQNSSRTHSPFTSPTLQNISLTFTSAVGMSSVLQKIIPFCPNMALDRELCLSALFTIIYFKAHR